MNRVELKRKAREMINGNKWYLWKPMVIMFLWILLISFGAGVIISLTMGADSENTKTVIAIVSSICSLVESVFMVGYAKYCLDFVRGNKYETGFEFKTAFNFAKEHFLTIFLVQLLISLIIIGGSILLVIPGIIFAIGHTFYQEVCADNIDLSVSEIVSKSWQLTKGHKADIFVLVLSFIGWILLAPFTLGILYIWLFPYMIITLVLAYEEIKK